MSPRISVIMGIYNCAPTLAEALDSLLAQTCQDFKVIMCDDGSTDNTINIARDYADFLTNSYSYAMSATWALTPPSITASNMPTQNM